MESMATKTREETVRPEFVGSERGPAICTRVANRHRPNFVRNGSRVVMIRNFNPKIETNRPAPDQVCPARPSFSTARDRPRPTFLFRKKAPAPKK